MNLPRYAGQGLFVHNTDFGLVSKFFSCFECDQDNGGNGGYRPTVFVTMDGGSATTPLSLGTYYPTDNDGSNLATPTDGNSVSGYDI